MQRSAQSGSALVIIVVAVLIVAVSGFAIWRWWAAAHSASQTQSNPTGLTAGDDNTSLDADLTTITKLINQEDVGSDTSHIADSILQTNRKLSALQSKIQTRITDAKDAGKNTGGLQTQVDTMNETLTEANITANSVHSKLAHVQQANIDPNQLSSYRDQLKSAHQQNVTALTDARTIVNALKEIK